VRSGAEQGLIAVCDSTIEKALDHAIANAAKVAKRFVDTADWDPGKSARGGWPRHIAL
jgi:hypothetical protein